MSKDNKPRPMPAPQLPNIPISPDDPFQSDPDLLPPIAPPPDPTPAGQTSGKPAGQPSRHIDPDDPEDDPDDTNRLSNFTRD